MFQGKNAVLATLLFLTALLSACSNQTTTVTDVQGRGRPAGDFSDILVVAASRNTEVRAAVGQALTTRLNRQGINASYLPAGDDLAWDTPSQLRSQLLSVAAEGRHDGILVVTLVDSRHHTRYEPETVTYIPDSRDIGPTASMTYMERSVQEESFERSVEYVIQSTLYDSATGEAVWQAVSSTTDPGNLEQGAEAFAAVIVDALTKPGGDT